MKNVFAKFISLTVLLTMGFAFVACSYDSGTSPNGGIGTVDYGSMTDSRDGKTYKTVRIANQVWMAQNLNYATGGSMCYDNDPSYCGKYGRLYTWNDAMNACPSGWHLPSKKEFETLKVAAGGYDVAGTALKSRQGWEEYEGKRGNGTDSLGFGALPAGRYYGYYDYFDNEGYYAYFWSSTELSSRSAYCLNLYYKYEYAFVSYDYKDYGLSVRCVQNNYTE